MGTCYHINRFHWVFQFPSKWCREVGQACTFFHEQLLGWWRLNKILKLFEASETYKMKCQEYGGQVEALSAGVKSKDVAEILYFSGMIAKTYQENSDTLEIRENMAALQTEMLDKGFVAGRRLAPGVVAKYRQGLRCI